MPTPLFLHHCRLAFPDFIAPGALLAEDGAITRIWLEETPAAPKNARVLDCEGMIIAPGLVDIHNHGGLSHDFVGANGAGNNIALKFHARHGVTAMLATVMTETHEQMSAALRLLAEQRRAGELCANFLGIHVEGPYFHAEKRGAHKLECLRDPVRSEYEAFWEKSDHLIRIFTHAPEREGSLEFCEFFHQRGCVPAIGHTCATQLEIRRAAAYGARHFVHANNAIDWPNRRVNADGWLGTEMMGMGTLLSHSALTGEIISDGYHVPLGDDPPPPRDEGERRHGARERRVSGRRLRARRIPPGRPQGHREGEQPRHLRRRRHERSHAARRQRHRAHADGP
jgi:N-acetylglucosamine-6-phosphate deacetylase